MSINLFDSGGGGGGGTTLETIVLTTSQTWTPPFNGTARIHVIGAGASGAGASSTSGAAGGYCRKDVTLSTGTNWTVVVGAGGVQTYHSQSGQAAGGNSSATDGSSTLTANGAGTHHTSAGTASGGDVNYTGGTGASGTEYGGGAVSIHSNSSGNVSYGGGATSDAGVDGFIPLGLGQLIGGRGGSLGTGDRSGGFLSGGGFNRETLSNTLIAGGDGGIGAGGGGAYNDSSSGDEIGGRGGDGLVIIQYLTVS